MLHYELTPASTASARPAWPVASRLARDPARPTLLMFVHPRCPCSSASLAELNVLASRCRDRVAIRIVFVRPSGFSEGWERTHLFDAAQRVLGASVYCDRDGKEAAKFGATASGEALLYDRDGRLLFQGGLTGSRGHEGDNDGLSCLTALIDSGHSENTRAAVYGCALFNPSSCHKAQCRCEP